MDKLYIFLVAMLSSAAAFSQQRQYDSNRIGISAGINQTSLQTDNFEIKPDMGWNAGLSIRGNFYNDFDMVYAVQFSEANFLVPTSNVSLRPEDAKLKLASAQISLMGSYKIIENHLSIEAGPVLQVNGKLTVDEEYEQNKIDDTTLRVSEILDVSNFNFLAAVGVTAGIKHLRLNVQYLYGVNNLLGNLNDDDLDTKLKGHLGIISGNLIVYF